MHAQNQRLAGVLIAAVITDSVCHLENGQTLPHDLRQDVWFNGFACPGYKCSVLCSKKGDCQLPSAATCPRSMPCSIATKAYVNQVAMMPLLRKQRSLPLANRPL